VLAAPPVSILLLNWIPEFGFLTRPRLIAAEIKWPFEKGGDKEKAYQKKLKELDE